MKHTLEPWTTVRDNHADCGLQGPCRVVWSESQGDVAYCPPTDDDNGNANTARIVACVNACEGLNPEAVPDLLATVEELIALAESGIFKGCEAHPSLEDSDAVAAARAARAKARR